MDADQMTRYASREAHQRADRHFIETANRENYTYFRFEKLLFTKYILNITINTCTVYVAYIQRSDVKLSGQAIILVY